MYPVANSSVCLSQQCVQASTNVYSRLSSNFQNIDPCTNFEEMVCGGLRERRVVPEWTNHVRELFDMMDSNYVLMKNILEAPYDKYQHSNVSSDQENFEMLVAGYNACMNETAIAERGVRPLVTFLGNVTESFPVTTDEYKSPKPFGPDDHESFSKTYRFFVEHALSPFLAVGVFPDADHPETYIPAIAPQPLTLPSSLYKDKEARSEYEKVIVQVFAKVLPTDESRSAAEELARGLVDLEEKIVTNIPPVDPYEIVRVVRSMDNATQLAPEFDLTSLFATLSPSHVNRIELSYSDYSIWLSQTLANTTKPTIQAFFLWQAILSYQSTVEGPELESLRQFLNVIAGKPPGYNDERWRTCVADADAKMAWLLSKPYVEVKYTEAIKKTVEEMSNRIQHRLANNINQIEWMTDKVKAIAKHKVESIIPKLGYPTAMPNLDDPNSIKDFYAGLKVMDSYFDNAISQSKWKSKSSAAQIGSNRPKGAWPADGAGSALTVNAFYSPQENSMLIIAGTLQQLVLDPTLPAYMNYGALGFIIGHEFTHSLDSTGRHFDEQGAYRNWWDADSEAGFNKAAQCLIDQYGANKVTLGDGSQVSVNGTQTLGENIADTGGINTAYDAWQDKRREDPASDFDLPALNKIFTHEQLFYVAASQWFCDKSNGPGIAEYVADVHSPPWIRIKSVMENSRGFREAFNCPVKEPTCVIY